LNTSTFGHRKTISAGGRSGSMPRTNPPPAKNSGLRNFAPQHPSAPGVVGARADRRGDEDHTASDGKDPAASGYARERGIWSPTYPYFHRAPGPTALRSGPLHVGLHRPPRPNTVLLRRIERT
jgi:hypothetical protein